MNMKSMSMYSTQYLVGAPFPKEMQNLLSSENITLEILDDSVQRNTQNGWVYPAYTTNKQ